MRNGPYNLVVAPNDYPGKLYRGRYAYEHHVVYWRANGELPGPGFVIHHINKDKRDNRPINLELTSAAEHGKHHAKRVDPVVVPCAQCGITIHMLPRDYRFKTKIGQRRFFCCRAHQHIARRKR